jgi:hypothetical protein
MIASPLWIEAINIEVHCIVTRFHYKRAKSMGPAFGLAQFALKIPKDFYIMYSISDV